MQYHGPFHPGVYLILCKWMGEKDFYVAMKWVNAIITLDIQNCLAPPIFTELAVHLMITLAHGGVSSLLHCCTILILFTIKNRTTEI